MPRIFFAFLLLLAGLSSPARAADGIPAKPDPFTFVTDQAHLLSPADARKLSNGLSKYAASTGTPVIVVTVPSLDGQSAADVARQIGNTWQVGQTDKNNGIVVLLSGQEHKLSIQAGSGMQSRITPTVVQQVIGEMTPLFKQNNYFDGLHKGLNTLMFTANPSSAPHSTSPAVATAATPDATPTSPSQNLGTTSPDPVSSQPAEPVSTGLPWGTILLGLVVLGGGFMLLRKVFGGNKAASSQAPDFTGNRPTGGNTPNFGAPNQGGGYGAAPSSGPGMGGLLATGAAAAAGAYLGERLGSNHDSNADTSRNFDDNNGNSGTGAAIGTGAADGYFSGNNAGSNPAGPDYFSDDNAANSNSGDYFSDDNTSSGGGDTSGDFGGGDFSSSDDNGGSW
ncbi:MAG: TPM domain-containing protein [Janthinobacterium lividum]